MIYLAIVWVLIGGYIVCRIVNRIINVQWFTRGIERYGSLVFLLALIFVIIAAATKDPLRVDIPGEIQLVVSGFAAGIGFWRVLIFPLYEAIHKLEIKMVEINMRLTHLEKRVDLIEHKIISTQ